MSPKWARRFFAFGSVAALLTALACGNATSSGNNDEELFGAPTPTSAPTENPNTDLAPNTAVVNIGDKTYEFLMDQGESDTCLTFFGTVAGGGQATDGSDVSLSLNIPPEDWEPGGAAEEAEPPSVEVEDKASGENWRAGGNLVTVDSRIEAGSSQVDSYTNDGTVAKGQATFIDYSAVSLALSAGEEPPGPVTGSFEVHCE